MDITRITAKSENERLLAEVLHTLRKVTSASTDDDKGRIFEVDRINATR